MAITRWDPFRELDLFSRRLGDLMNMGQRGGEGRDQLSAADWYPTVDIAETKEEYLITAELPGVKKDDITIDVDKGVLTLRGERKSEHEEKRDRIHRIERSYGQFVRSFSLPENVNEDMVKAEYKDGLLKVHLGKQERKNGKGRRIDIK